MQYLKQYKKLCHITCLSCLTHPSQNLLFQVRFQQSKPHSVFKYELIKHKEEVKQLYNILQEDIFDFENPFHETLIKKLTKKNGSFKEEINQSLRQCIDRIDVITHQAFVHFFCIELHFGDFQTCLRQEQASLEKEAIESHHDPSSDERKPKEKQSNSQFQKNTTLISHLEHCQLELMPQTEVLDFTHTIYYENQLLYILQQPKKTAKIKNFFKNVFSQPSSKLGLLSIHRKDKNRYTKVSQVDILAEPIAMTFIEKTNMILVTTHVGVYIYLAKMETKLEEIEIFAYVELLGCVACCNNALKAQCYLLSKAQVGELHVYSINQQKLMKTQHKYQNPSSLCFQEQHSRLYVSDSQGIHIYSIVEYLEIKKLHLVEIDSLFCQLTINHGYLLAISQKGFMTVLELKPPHKEQLISVTTNITLPEGSTHLVGSSKNRRLLVTHFNRNVVLIDTMEGPIYSYKSKGGSTIQSLLTDRNNNILALTADGFLERLRLNEVIK